MGERENAGRLRKAVVDYTLRNWDSAGPHQYFGGLALERTGERDKAQKIMEKAARPSAAILDVLRKELK